MVLSDGPRVALRCGVLLVSALLVSACNGNSSPSGPALFLIRVCSGSEHAPGGELFRVRINDPEVIAEGERLIGAGQSMILIGPLREGDGGFNAPWSWHLDPDEVFFAEGAIELCDGCPSFIEADLPYWLDNVGNYCPWSTEVVSRES